MIPIRLEITNFLSYEQTQVLDFHGIHLACISGPNGSGKSSLLDAVTWSLFGRSRSRSDDNIVNKLAAGRGDAAVVILTFELEGVIYQVERVKKVGKTMRLDFLIAVDEDGWNSLSEATIRDTQASIEQLLRMNFETFTNASFILQDKADTFTTSTPSHRKEVLGDLIGLDIWNSYKDVAAVQRREEENQLSFIDRRLADIDVELEQEAERWAALQDALSRVTEAAEQVIVQKQVLDDQRRIEKAVEQQKHLIDALDENIETTLKSLVDIQRIQEQRLRERQEYQELLDNADEIHKKMKAWSQANDSLREWQEKSQQHSDLLVKMRPHELEIERERAQLNQQLSELEAQSVQVAQYKQEGQDCVELLDSVEKQMNELEKQLLELNTLEVDIKREEEKLGDLKAKRSLVENEVRLLNEQGDRVQKQREEIEQLKKDLTLAKGELSSNSSALSDLEVMQAKLATRVGLLESVQKAQIQLREEMAEIKVKIETLDDVVGGLCPLCGQELSPEHQETVLEQLVSDGKSRGERFRENKNSITVWDQEISEIRTKLEKKEQYEQIVQNWNQQVAELTANLKQHQKSIHEWESGDAVKLEKQSLILEDNNDILGLEKSVLALVGKLKEKAGLEEKISSLKDEESRITNQIESLNRTVSDWNARRDGKSSSEMYQEIKEKVKRNEFAGYARAQFDMYSNQIDEVGYNRDFHEAASGSLESLIEVPGKYQKLSEAETAVKHLDDILLDLSGQLSTSEGQVSRLKEQFETAQSNLESLAVGALKLADLERDLQAKREEEIAAHRRAAATQQNVDVLEKLKEIRIQVTSERERKSILLQQLGMLEKAFGRDGVQSMLIERALPELEDDANFLLDRLTEGGMQIRFETQRKLKSVDRIAETLDIHISDFDGERPYENYSGGEQFRINFAVRLALSKILTRRAGARLQTLVVDEGFGSQDPLGRQRLIEAINIVQDDFERILVITHIDELRDAFPTQIKVSKSRTGSIFSVD